MGHQAVRYKRFALHSCFLLSLLTCKLCSPPLHSLPGDLKLANLPPPLRSRRGCGKYWKFTIKVHLGRVAFERHASEVDFDRQFPMFFAPGSNLPQDCPKMAARWPQDGSLPRPVSFQTLFGSILEPFLGHFGLKSDQSNVNFCATSSYFRHVVISIVYQPLFR